MRGAVEYAGHHYQSIERAIHAEAEACPHGVRFESGQAADARGMKRPSFQFYPADWRNNAKLRFCSWGARGAWIEVLGLMHDSDDYGVIFRSLRDISSAIGAPHKLLKELAEKGVLYGTDKGTCEPMIYRAKHANGEGDAVALIEEQQGPVWYSPRMVRDEYVRTVRGKSSRFGESPKGGLGDEPNQPPNQSPKQFKGDGSTSSSSSTYTRSRAFIASEQTSPSAGDSFALGGGDVGSVSDKQAFGAVEVCKALRKIGLRVQPQDPNLLALVAEKFTTGELALAAAEKALKAANLWDDPDTDPELHEKLASGATQQVMRLTNEQHNAIKAAAANVGSAYLASTLRGRRRDAQQNASPPRRADKPRANANFEDKEYAGTPVDKLSPELRAAMQREHDGPG